VVEERRLLGSRWSAEQKPLGTALAPARPCRANSAASSGRPTATTPCSGPRGRPPVLPALSQGGPEERRGELEEEGDQENREERRRGMERIAAPTEGGATALVLRRRQTALLQICAGREGRKGSDNEGK
jgi:hypothetical protein